MISLQPVRGTHDLLPEEFRNQKAVADLACKISELYGFQEMTPPVFELSEVFDRTLGETSDVVTKEMYSFKDRGGDIITLRPEFTAGIARAFLTNGLTQQAPVKFFSRGPVFRHERPQKGRFRQFHQINVEVIGSASPVTDIEVIALGAHILEELGLSGDINLKLNTLGDIESRHYYRTKLTEYLLPFQSELSKDSQMRLKRNPLRIFDSKDSGDQKILEEAPLLKDYLNDISCGFFDDVCGGLSDLGIAYHIDTRLVRGLDYYTHTAFEFVTSNLGAQGTVMAGGRYDGLIKAMSGKVVPGIGWAAGIERLAIMRDSADAAPSPISVIPVSHKVEKDALKLTKELRDNGIAADIGYSGNMKKRMVRANKLGSSFSVIIGEDELARNNVLLRNMKTGEQVEVPLAKLKEHLTSQFL